MNQTLDKLRAMKLEGMAQALEEQSGQSDIDQLDFQSRLGLLVERQWLWKDNVKLHIRKKTGPWPGDSTTPS